GEAAERPGHARNGVWRVPFRHVTGAPRGRWTEAIGARGFNPLPKWAPGGRRGSDPVRTARAISARACGVRLSAPRGCSRRPVRTARSPIRDPHAPPTGPSGPRATGRRTRPARPPPPPVRSPAGRPPQRWGEEQYGAALEVKDEIGSRFFKALISWGFILDIPRMNTALPQPPSSQALCPGSLVQPARAMPWRASAPPLRTCGGERGPGHEARDDG
ncbi:hypothetical protein PMI01_02586, partial [Caulobacter sp. AP07]